MSELHLEETLALGRNRGRGNLLGLEPYISAADYRSARTLQAKVDRYLLEAKSRGWLTDRTVVVLPEYFGTWLVLADEPDSVFATDRLAVAEQRLVLRHLAGFLRHLVAAKEKGRLEAAVFRLKARTMAEAYHSVLSHVAKHYRVTVVGGSTVLPAPHVSRGRLQAGRGPLYGVTPVYGPDGRAYSELVLKAYPTAEELPFMTPSRAAAVAAFDTPAGRLGILICADSWFPDCYARLAQLKVEVIAVPSNGGDPAIWDQPWGGYSGWPTPGDVKSGDMRRLTEGDAWRKYALAGRIGQTAARAGLNVFIRGQLLDMAGGGGRTTAVKNGSVLVDRAAAGAALISLWL